MSRNWIIAGVAAVCLVGSIVLSHRIEPGVRVEKVTLAKQTPALEFLPAGPGRRSQPPDFFAIALTNRGTERRRGHLLLWRNGDHLVWRALGKSALQGALDLYPESETNFLLKINGAQVTFIKNDKGEVTAVIHQMA